MKVVGTMPTTFTGKDGTLISGTTLFVTEPIDPKKGKGERTDKLFLSTQKLADLPFVPAVGMEITVYYNKFGKPATVVSDVDAGIDLA